MMSTVSTKNDEALGPERLPPSLPVLLRALTEAVENSSLRDVAAEVGIRATALDNIIRAENRRPYGKTLTKLARWYMDRAASGVVDDHVRAVALFLDKRGHPVQKEVAQRSGAMMAPLLAGPRVERAGPRVTQARCEVAQRRLHSLARVVGVPPGRLTAWLAPGG